MTRNTTLLLRAASHGFSRMRLIIFVFLGYLLAGCQFDYLLKSGYNQAKLLANREDIEKVLDNPKVDDETKRKLRLAVSAKQFAESRLGLKQTKNYTSFVQLETPYVSYVVSAAPRYRLEAHLWKYPLVGKLPYKGFFTENEARQEAQTLEAEELDTHVRGVSAFSTLGYFKDPILSSMLRYRDHDLVNTIIHETVHATLYIKSSADFNERLAVFLGNKGTELFYREKEGESSKTLSLIANENSDDELFSKFFTAEFEALKKWFETTANLDAKSKKVRISELQKKFETTIKSRLKGDQYQSFAIKDLNNAELIVYSMYISDLADFECLFQKLEKKFDAMLSELKKLESSDKPESELKKMCG